MQTLSSEYKDLIQTYHRESAHWGSGSHRHAGFLAEMLDDGDTVLDYGCGKGTLKIAMAGYDVREFDPGIPGKDAEPEPADVVVCTDVLEHIEPEYIDKVIGHIYSLARKRVFLTIAMRPAHAVLPDGRNAHLIIEGLDWWKEKLSKHFVMDSITTVGMKDGALDGEATIVASPIHELKDIPAKGAIDDAVRGEQMASCMARGLPRVEASGGKGEVVLLCYGPSLNEMFPMIKSFADRGVPIVTVSGAHDWLIERGLVPYAHSDIDGREHKSRILNRPDHRVKYWMASVCHPAYFDKLDGYDVSTFHIMNSDDTVEWVKRNDPGSWLLTGGLTVGNRVLGLLHHMGYETIHVFGMDCSFSEDARHAGPHTGKVQKKMQIRCGDEWFTSSPQMISAARDIIASLDHMKLVSDVTFYGNGLLQKMIREATGLNGLEKAA
jgi:hypothetical protein